MGDTHALESHRLQHRLEDVAWMKDGGASLEEILDRLGITKSALQQNYTRAGVPWPWPREE